MATAKSTTTPTIPRNDNSSADSSADSQSEPLSPTQSAAADSLESGADDTEVPAAESSRETRIREAAYRRYEARGGSHGEHDNDWAEAAADIDREDSGR